MLKRPRGIFNTPISSSPPSLKRAHLTGSSASTSTYSSPLKPFHNATIPEDSPTNPFSTKLNDIVTLPRGVSFTKYFTLRFQIVPSEPSKARKSASYRLRAGNAYRTVHVPRNYSFKVLYKLIRFLFDFEPSLDHVFEVQEGVEMYATSTNKPGMIKKGRTCVKLSRNFDDSLRQKKGRSGKQIEEIVWMGEDDFTVGTAWPDGLVPDRAIIYRHDCQQTVHITIATLKIPSRNGVSNRPFVFIAEDSDGPVDDYDCWNRGKSFEKFLRASIEDVPEEEKDDDDDDSCPESVPSSDPLTPVTPYPSAPLLQMRLESAHRRMSRKVPKFKGDVSSSEEEEEKEKEKEQEEQEEQEEELNEADQFDPFGDEAEL